MPPFFEPKSPPLLLAIALLLLALLLMDELDLELESFKDGALAYGSWNEEEFWF